MSNTYIWLSVSVMALVTAALRFLPFAVLSGKKTPKIVQKLGSTLPFAIMGMLVVYCSKDVSFTSTAGFIPWLIACIAVALTYIWKRNTLASIIIGTLCYMFMVQVVF